MSRRPARARSVAGWEHRDSAELDASPEAVYGLFTDPATWPDWDPAVTDASADGTLAVGSAVTVTQRSAPTRRLEVVEMEPSRSYAHEDRLPGARLRFEYTVEPLGDGRSRVTFRRTIRGPLTFVFRRVLGPRIVAGTRPQLDGLAKAASGGGAPGSA